MSQTCAESGLAVFMSMGTSNKKLHIPEEKIKNELETQGYSVVHGLIPLEKCDEYTLEFRAWLDRFEEDSPVRRRSILHQYRTSHSNAAWRLRLHAKPVYESIWGTEKLLTSVDGMSIAEPPEQGRSNFSKPEDCWFHLDQGSRRKGLHAYQGAVYLEGTTPSDYCFRVLEGSQKYHQDLMDTFSDINEEMAGREFYILKNHHLEFYQNKGCAIKKVPVPKGGMVLWDSRTVHDTLAPVEGRPHADRWRFVIYVCMTPAIWASKKDFEVKRKAYEEMLSSAHWPSQGVKLFPGTDENEQTKLNRIEMVEEQPPIARTRLVRLLAGMEAYDFTDGRPNGPDWEPSWAEIEH